MFGISLGEFFVIIIDLFMGTLNKKSITVKQKTLLKCRTKAEFL